MLEIITKHIQLAQGIPFDKEIIPPQMLSEKCELYEGDDYFWKAIPSKIKDSEIADLEQQIGYPLPQDYKTFLQHYYFLDLHIGYCTFPALRPENWQQPLLKMIFDGYPQEDLIEVGRIPFADWEDWGMLCFDTTARVENADYPIVLWDHERFDQFEWKFENFAALWTALDD